MMAARMRLRPIIMTSLAFWWVLCHYILPPQVQVQAVKNAVGTGVLGGVLTSTFLGIFSSQCLCLGAYAISYKPKAQPVTHAKLHEHV